MMNNTEFEKIVSKNIKFYMNDIGIMCDFITLTRKEFLEKYFYIQFLEYDIMQDLYFANRTEYLMKYCTRLKEIENFEVVQVRKTQLESEIQKLSEKQKKIFNKTT